MFRALSRLDLLACYKRPDDIDVADDALFSVNQSCPGPNRSWPCLNGLYALRLHL